ncbi:hypothetical protein BCY86_08400 [Pajaroellobacter abortibovis]|uniref:Translocation and assembly module TamB C-terminal domain-containing protein n=2 Tax=Pajaroellobacter abortibovis TaxID=1882918 RepID=A0A1L6MZ77_9BACT|nr:hypothetical protein BCY86_08400 [Pajaroellobacter abortibovis]
MALMGILSVGVPILLQLPWIEQWIGSQVDALLKKEGIEAHYRIKPMFAPLGIALEDLQIASLEQGGAPVLSCAHARIRVRPSALLSGKRILGHIEMDEPYIHLVIREGKIVNFPISISSLEEQNSFEIPFRQLNINQAVLDLEIDHHRVNLRGVDVEMRTRRASLRRSPMEVRLHIAGAKVRRSRSIGSSSEGGQASLAYDDDSLCGMDAHIRVGADMLWVDSLVATGAMDTDRMSQNAAGCYLSPSASRRMSLSLWQVRVGFPRRQGEAPGIRGQISVRIPLTWLGQFADLGDVGGWLETEGELDYQPGMKMPEGDLIVRGEDIRLGRYQIAKQLEGHLVLEKNKVRGPSFQIGLAGGEVHLSDLEIDPFEAKIPMQVTASAKQVDFTELMRALGVSEHPHVGWEIKTLEIQRLVGTLHPLRMDGQLFAKTTDFRVADRPIEDQQAERIFSFTSATLQSRLALRPDSIQFHGIRAVLPSSRLEDGFVSLGFNNELRVRVPRADIHFADLTPLLDLPILGHAYAGVNIQGTFSDPVIEAQLKVERFSLGTFHFGSIEQAQLSFVGMMLSLRDVHVIKGNSAYQIPIVHLDFGGLASVEVDAQVASTQLGLRDLLSVLNLEADPRFDDMDGKLGIQGEIRLAVGGPRDPCRSGSMDIRAEVTGKSLSFYGEQFKKGALSLRFQWLDQLAGLEGAEIDIPSFSLVKHEETQKGLTVGSIFGSLFVKRGGALGGTVTFEKIPLLHVQALGSFAEQMEGSLSGWMHLGGTIAAYQAKAQVEVDSVRVAGIPLGPSYLELELRRPAAAVQNTQKTICGGIVSSPFDPSLYASIPWHYWIRGSLFNQQIELHDVLIEKKKAVDVRGAVEFRQLDIGKIVTKLLKQRNRQREEDGSVNLNVFEGALSGVLAIDRWNSEDIASASVRFTPSLFFLARPSFRLDLKQIQGRESEIRLVQDSLLVSPCLLNIQSRGEVIGSLGLRGGLNYLSGQKLLDFQIDLSPLDLRFLEFIFPDVKRVGGVLAASVSMKGNLLSPKIVGGMQVRNGELLVKEWLGSLTRINMDIDISQSQLRLKQASAQWGGGTLKVEGGVPLYGFSFGRASVSITARGIQLTPKDGISVAFDADLVGTMASGMLPQLSGDIFLTSLEYTRPMNLIGDLGVKLGKRQSISSFNDPQLDVAKFDLRVRAQNPLRLRNNLAEIQFVTEPEGILILGTNQRVGLQGNLKALSGGRVRFRSTDFDIQQASLHFRGINRLIVQFNAMATTEYRRVLGSNVARASNTSKVDEGQSGRWKIALHMYGDGENIHFDLSSDPPLSSEDIALLLTMGMTRAELQGGVVGASVANVIFEALAAVSGADRAVREAVPVIDEVRFGSSYSSRLGLPVPQVTMGKRVTEALRGSVTTSFSQKQEVRANLEWTIGPHWSLQGAYDNINNISSSWVGNLGADLRWRLEIE